MIDRKASEMMKELGAKATARPWESDCEGIARHWRATEGKHVSVLETSCDPCGWSGCSGARLFWSDGDRELITTAANAWDALGELVSLIEDDESTCSGCALCDALNKLREALK